MSISKPITTSLFSFKTFRSPDKIDFNEKEEFFIHHPDVTLSAFYKCNQAGETNNDTEQHDALLRSIKSVKSYKDIRAKHPALYDYSCLLMQQRKNDSTKSQLNAALPALLDEQEILMIWEELFVQTATQSSNTVRQACIQLIIAQHYLQFNEKLELKDIAKLVVVIPDFVIACFKARRFSKCGGELFGVQNLGIQEYRRVEQTLCCYVPGEVSHIENIMAKEYKEKSTRNLLRTEYTTEINNETEIENINDTTTTERHELNSEVAKELQKDKSFDISGSVSVSKDSGVYNFAANVSSGYNSSSSSSQSNTEAKNYAKEITERALERVVQKTTEKRTFKMIKEFEENNKHGFDNTKGELHVTGVYRWVDKIYDNELVNYGRRLLFEISVPSPAEFYKKAMAWKSKTSQSAVATITPPAMLSSLGINSWADINNNSILLGNEAYGLAIESYKDEVEFVDVNFNTETEHSNSTNTDVQNAISIPLGFVADRIDGSGSFKHKGTSNTKAFLELSLANYIIYRGMYQSTSQETDTFSINIDISPNALGSLSFVVSYRKVYSYSVSFKVRCITDPKFFTEWQEETYLALQVAYQHKLDAYNEELALQQAAQEAEADQRQNNNYSNPGMNRLIEERELKRLCIEMMSKPYCYDMGKSFTTCKTYACESECAEVENQVTEVVQNQALERYAEFIKFFETAFQWEIFSYIFYPYYYAAKCNWSALLQTKNDDPIFEAFLQSGMSKVLVPVRPQFEKAVMWYIETGEIYTDENLLPEVEDDRYLSLVKDLRNQEEIRVEGKWKTRVPSALTIIQAKSSYLEDAKGLPCCDDETGFFGRDERMLGSLKPE